MKDLVQKLVQTPGPSGYEHQIRALVRQEVEPHADEIHVDNLGNLIARKGQARDDGLKVMLAAHIDEIGIMVTHIDENGYARFTNIGGLNRSNLLGGRVRFLDGTLGVIGAEKLSSANRVPNLSELFIDLGVTHQEDSPVAVGDVGAFERPFLEIGDRWVSKAMDDRIGVAVLIDTLRQLEDTPHTLHFVFSVQEEVGVRGATTAAYKLDPDLGLAVDVTRTGDTPKGIKMEVSLGDGPAIKVRDAGMLSDPRVVDWMVRSAQDAHIPYQMEVLERGGTDARAIQLTRAGVPAGCLSIPCRYIHSPSEMVDRNDVHNAVQLLLKLVGNPTSL
jgi:endoglucanase